MNGTADVWAQKLSRLIVSLMMLGFQSSPKTEPVLGFMAQGPSRAKKTREASEGMLPRFL